MKSYRIILTDKIPVCENAVLFRFSCYVEEFSFKAGQYAFFTIPENDYEDVKGNTRAFSFAGSPLKKGIIEICARIGSSKFTSHLNELKTGSQLFISDAKGNLNKFFQDTDNMVISAGGLGITPVRSFLEDTILRNSKKNIVLIYGNKTPASAAFLNELINLKNILNDYKFVPVFESDHRGIPEFEKGKLNSGLIMKYADKPFERKHLILGPPGMVTTLESEFRLYGIPEKNIFIEKY